MVTPLLPGGTEVADGGTRRGLQLRRIERLVAEDVEQHVAELGDLFPRHAEVLHRGDEFAFGGARADGQPEREVGFGQDVSAAARRRQFVDGEPRDVGVHRRARSRAIVMRANMAVRGYAAPEPLW